MYVCACVRVRAYARAHRARARACGLCVSDVCVVCVCVRVRACVAQSYNGARARAPSYALGACGPFRQWLPGLGIAFAAGPRPAGPLADGRPRTPSDMAPGASFSGRIRIYFLLAQQTLEKRYVLITMGSPTDETAVLDRVRKFTDSSKQLQACLILLLNPYCPCVFLTASAASKSS